VVHNGEISSYGINRRYLEGFGYHCALQTDTEVICYLVDLLVRKHGLGFDLAAMVLAAPFWDQIERMPEEARAEAHALRVTYGGALLNGPFSVLIGHRGGMVGLNDRIKLRPMVAARHGDTMYVASEESAIRVVCPRPDEVWSAEGGKPIVAEVKPRTASVA
jgi:glutamate synthase domain-containing protein 1